MRIKVSNGLFSLVLVCCLPKPLAAITQYKKGEVAFVRDPSLLKASLPLPTSDGVVSVKMPVAKMKARAYKAEKDTRIEALQLYVPKEKSKLTRLVKTLAKTGQAKKLEALFIQQMSAQAASNDAKVRVVIGPKEFKLLRMASLADELAKPHHVVDVDAEVLNRQAKMRDELLQQVEPFLSDEKRRAISQKLANGQDLNVEHDLLTRFAEKMIGKYVIYRGPNCFHASLAFHGQKWTRSPLINVKEEPGYHRSMINYDELWRAINKNFYRVDPEVSPLKYGDMIVFFDVPDNPGPEVNFRWIRHTATYLFGPYTFSKGSKSPDTPYTVKTVNEEWETWRTYSKNLGVQIYRRNSENLRSTPPRDVVDWIY